ncbi:hypothetical protein NITHO_330005 [Nitrolancea hollandica Lb]|uniref:Uncharacterized protein n=1 Tax=Nitrolancea hollandica Lb TaxID=1129897 RepID=I4EHX0_9BACT|nr:hypothetical protein NITHO_330005 [Nitrolancea hollandica Lb]
MLERGHGVLDRYQREWHAGQRGRVCPVNHCRAGSSFDRLAEKVVAIQSLADYRDEEVSRLDLPGIVPNATQKKITVGIAQERAPGALNHIPQCNHRCPAVSVRSPARGPPASTVLRIAG